MVALFRRIVSLSEVGIIGAWGKMQILCLENIVFFHQYFIGVRLCDLSMAPAIPVNLQSRCYISDRSSNGRINVCILTTKDSRKLPRCKQDFRFNCWAIIELKKRPKSENRFQEATSPDPDYNIFRRLVVIVSSNFQRKWVLAFQNTK